MEIKTAEEIAKKHLDIPFSDSTYHINPYIENGIYRSMREYASQAVRLALEEAGTLVSSRTAKDHKGNHVGAWMDDADILSLADEIIGKLK